MTAGELISQVDRLKCNGFSWEEKRNWLNQLEWTIKREILDTHGPGLAFREITGEDSPLLAPEPYTQVYAKWLESQMDLYNGEMERFNASITLFNREYKAFESWYHRTHPAKGLPRWRW